MTRPIDVAFTDSVKSMQERFGSRRGYEGMAERGGWSNAVSPDLTQFIAQRESFYLGTASADGRPYIQHRGGEPGFLRVLDDRTLGFADYPGNKQYVSMGNLAENDQAFLFLMDYRHRQRIKIWGRARFVEDDEALLARIARPGETVTRAIVFDVELWDANCPKHIPVLFSEREVAERVEPLEQRIRELEAELARRG